MPIIKVTTDEGVAVKEFEVTSQQIARLTCPANVVGSSFAAGIRRAVEDAEAISAGRHPERASEMAMRHAESEPELWREHEFGRKVEVVAREKSPNGYTIFVWLDTMMRDSLRHTEFIASFEKIKEEVKV